VREAGVEVSESDFVKGVTDLSAPILLEGVAVVTLTIPFVERKKMRHDIDHTTNRLRSTVARISDSLLSSDT